MADGAPAGRYAPKMAAKKREAVEERARKVLRRAANDLADVYIETSDDTRLSGALLILEVLGEALHGKDTRAVTTLRKAAKAVMVRWGSDVDDLTPERALANHLATELRKTPRTKFRGVAAWLREAAGLFPALRIHRSGQTPSNVGPEVDLILERISAVSVKASHVTGASPRKRAQLCRCVDCESARIVRALVKRRTAK